MNIGGAGGYGYGMYGQQPALGRVEAELKALDARPDLTPGKKETARFNIAELGMAADEAVIAAEKEAGGSGASFGEILRSKMGG